MPAQDEGSLEKRIAGARKWEAFYQWTGAALTATGTIFLGLYFGDQYTKHVYMLYAGAASLAFGVAAISLGYLRSDDAVKRLQEELAELHRKKKAEKTTEPAGTDLNRT